MRTALAANENRVISVAVQAGPQFLRVAPLVPHLVQQVQVSERAVLTDPAAVSGHLAICGAPTGASQPLRRCRPAVKYLTRLNRFTFVTARSSLCLRLVRFVASSDPRLDSR